MLQYRTEPGKMSDRMSEALGRGTRWVVGVARVLALGMALLLPAAGARAQLNMTGMMESGLVSKRNVNDYAKVLGLDKDQTEAAMTLLDGSRAANETLLKDFKSKMQELQNKMMGEDRMGAVKEMSDLGIGLQEKMQKLEKQFFDDLKSICTEEQAARWDHVERMRRREQGMRFGFVSGAQVDLIALADRQKLSDSGEVKDVLAEYEVAIDKPLMQLKHMRDEQAKRQKDMMDKMMKDPMSGMAEAKKMLGELADLGKEMRGINRDYARKISGVLPEAARARFEDEIARRSFPRVYQEAYAGKLLSAAAGLADLSASQKETIEQIQRSYADEIKPLNERWAKAIEAQEDKHNGMFGVMMDVAMSQAMGGADDTIKDANEAKAARKDLDEKTQKRINEVLTEPQKAKMPEKKVEPDMPWMDTGGDDAEDSADK